MNLVGRYLSLSEKADTLGTGIRMRRTCADCGCATATVHAGGVEYYRPSTIAAIAAQRQPRAARQWVRNLTTSRNCRLLSPHLGTPIDRTLGWQCSPSFLPINH